MLLRKGATLQLHDNDGRTPLHLACYKGHTKVARLLIDKGSDLQSVDKWGRTPLHWAAKYGKINVAKLLIECGASMRCKDQWGLTALQWACINGHMELASVLSDNGADMSNEETSTAKAGDHSREWHLTTTPQQLQEEVRLRKAAERKAAELEGSLAEAEAVVIELGETIDARVAEERAAADQLRLQLDIALNRAAQLQIQLSEYERNRLGSDDVPTSFPTVRHTADYHTDTHGENGGGVGNKNAHKLHVLLDKLQESEKRRADVEQQVQ